MPSAPMREHMSLTAAGSGEPTLDVPCISCGEPADFGLHRQTAAECNVWMLIHEGRPCANPAEHHLYPIGTPDGVSGEPVTELH